MLKCKKGQLQELGKLGIGIATLAIVLAVTFLILATARTNVAQVQGFAQNETGDYTVAYNATRTLTDAVEDVPGWVPIIVITMIGVVLLSLVSAFRRN